MRVPHGHDRQGAPDRFTSQARQQRKREAWGPTAPFEGIPLTIELPSDPYLLKVLNAFQCCSCYLGDNTFTGESSRAHSSKPLQLGMGVKSLRARVLLLLTWDTGKSHCDSSIAASAVILVSVRCPWGIHTDQTRKPVDVHACSLETYSEVIRQSSLGNTKDAVRPGH